MPVLTNQAASAWFRMGLAQARAQRSDVLIENSFHNADIVLAEAQRFKDAGYQTHAIALAVPSRDSRLGALTRYVDALAAGETARWTNLASHQAVAPSPGLAANDRFWTSRLLRIYAGRAVADLNFDRACSSCRASSTSTRPATAGQVSMIE